MIGNVTLVGHEIKMTPRIFNGPAEQWVCRAARCCFVPPTTAGLFRVLG